MQIQILKPRANGKHYPDYDEFIRNASCDEERKCLVESRKFAIDRALKGDEIGFNFGIVYVTKMGCGHYELFQHPIFREYGEEPTENDIIRSLQDMLEIVKETKNNECTKCTCHF